MNFIHDILHYYILARKRVIINPIFGAISAKFRTFDMQINFAIPPNSALHGLLEEFFFLYQRYKISNTLAINSLGNTQHFRTVPILIFLFSPLNKSLSEISVGMHN